MNPFEGTFEPRRQLELPVVGFGLRTAAVDIDRTIAWWRVHGIDPATVFTELSHGRPAMLAGWDEIRALMLRVESERLEAHYATLLAAA